MHHSILSILILFSLSLVNAGCGTKPEPAPPEDGGTFVCWGEIQPLFDQRCVSCHGAGTASGGVRFDSYEEASGNASRANVRVRADTMPPAGPLPPAEKKILQDWVASGTPLECPGDGGVDADGEDGGSVVDCSTGSYWNPASGEGPFMRPGSNCLYCHTGAGEAPAFAAAGTVMGAFHDVDNCVGIGGATIRIETPSSTFSLVTNAGGNFYLAAEDGAIGTPYQVRIIFQGHEQAMTASQTNRNCMDCHTRDGAHGAPGRITIP